MFKETVLIVDDEEDILELIKYNLNNEGYSVFTAKSGEQAIEMTKQLDPNLVVLDLMLPGMDGLEVTRYLRSKEKTRDLPIVILTAKGDETDIITGLELGANDYIAKPFSPKVLAARIRAILRRQMKKNVETPERINQAGDLIIDRAKRIVTIGGKPLSLTFSEFELLSLLSDKKGWVFTREQIVDAIHGENYSVTDRSVDVIVVGLRRKLKHHSFFIETVRGVGYRFKE